MRIDLKFKLREIAGEQILVNQGTPGVNLTRVISLNKSACFLFEQLTGRDFTEEDVARALAEKYGLARPEADRDARLWIEQMQQCGVITPGQTVPEEKADL